MVCCQDVESNGDQMEKASSLSPHQLMQNGSSLISAPNHSFSSTHSVDSTYGGIGYTSLYEKPNEPMIDRTSKKQKMSVLQKQVV